MLENFLTDELALAITISGDPHSLGATQRFADGFQLADFVATLRRACSVKPVGPKKDRRPTLPGRVDILRLKQIEQMALGGKDVSIARPDGIADGIVTLIGRTRTVICGSLSRWTTSPSRAIAFHLTSFATRFGSMLGSL